MLIVAAGFEPRATRVLEVLAVAWPKRVVLVEYVSPESANETNLTIMRAALMKHSSRENVRSQPFDPNRPDEFILGLKRILSDWRPDAIGEVWIDVSALPMQGICAALAAAREALPELVVRTLYTEARMYFPTRAEARADGEAARSALSQEMSGYLIPKHFGGSLSESLTCLVLFAGYEAHRSIGVVDELNPSKLVLVYGRPFRPELGWRENWSRRLHSTLGGTRPTATEIVSTQDALESLELLERYYGFLFADHNFAISPVCSKMQTVASFLMWERYRDVQLVFPLPVTYLPKRSSQGVRDMFEFELPSPSRSSNGGVLPQDPSATD